MNTEKSTAIFAGKIEGDDCCADQKPADPIEKSPDAPMQKYLGVKIIHAEPKQGEKWMSKKFEDRNDHTPVDGYKVVYEDGYESWSPKDVFEKAYRPIDSLTFGLAIEALKMGKCVARKGWNGKGMFLWLNKGVFDGRMLGFKPGENINPSHGSLMDGVKLGLFENGPEGVATRLPNINMRSASGSTVTGWLASQTDMLAEDWMIVE